MYATMSFKVINFMLHRVVKLTSPNLNYVIVFGAILMLIGNLFLPSRNVTVIAISCNVSLLTA